MPPSPQTWIWGDLHIENFGSFKSDNRSVYFDLNDLDEAVLAPASWELARIVTSIFIAFESLEIEQKRNIQKKGKLEILIEDPGHSDHEIKINPEGSPLYRATV